MFDLESGFVNLCGLVGLSKYSNPKVFGSNLRWVRFSSPNGLPPHRLSTSTTDLEGWLTNFFSVCVVGRSMFLCSVALMSSLAYSDWTKSRSECGNSVSVQISQEKLVNLVDILLGYKVTRFKKAILSVSRTRNEMFIV